MDEPNEFEGWTEEMKEEYRLDELMSPLFDMFLDFERKFADHAIDVLNITNDDAEKFAIHMAGTDAGAAFGYLLRRISVARTMRRIIHKLETVVAQQGWPEGGLSFPEIHEKYEKIHKGEA